MALSQTQKNDVFEAIRGAGLDPGDFGWAPGSVMLDGGQETIYRLGGAGRFEFAFYNRDWWFYCEPGDEAPYDQARAGSWRSAMEGLLIWARSLRGEINAPDLWGELRRERELLAQPNEAGEAENTPFTSEELARISKQIADLKTYLIESRELTQDQQLELEVRLDYIERSAPRMGRIDWWNLFTGALLNLVLTGLIPPHVVQTLLILAAHGLAGLFGGGPPELLDPRGPSTA